MNNLEKPVYVSADGLKKLQAELEELRTAKRTVADINGERFVPGSELSMLIDGKRRLVRMETAQDNAVIVSVDGQRQTLQLGAK